MLPDQPVAEQRSDPWEWELARTRALEAADEARTSTRGDGYCTPQCRRAAERQRARALHPTPDAQTVRLRRRPRVTATDPAEVAAELEAFKAQLERETLASLKRDSSRWAWKRSTDPDEHRRLRRQPRRTAT